MLALSVCHASADILVNGINSKVYTHSVSLDLDSPPISPQEYLRSIASGSFDLLNCIVQKESGWKMVWNYMHDSNPNYYTAFGYFQIVRSTAEKVDPTLDRMNPFDNLKLGVKIYNKLGIKQWLVWEQCVPKNHFIIVGWNP